MDIDNRIYCSKCMQEMQEEGVCPHCGYDQAEEKNTSVLARGTLLNGRYQLGTVIGRGGFGITYAGWDEILGVPVAVKEFFPMDYCTRNTDLSDDVLPLETKAAVYLDGLQRFRRESHLLAELQGIPGIVKVSDFFSENGTAYIAMEYVRGVPADRWVEEKKLSPEEILSLMRPVIDSLVRIHQQGVLHRDLTPENILICENGTAKLIDFGSATIPERSAGTVVLTRKYAAVEQYGSEHGAQGPWTDVYGISAVLYRLLTGSAPQESVLRVYSDELIPLRKHGVRLKKEQDAAIMNGLSVDPARRTQSVEELRARLYHLQLPQEIIRHRRTVRRIRLAAAVFLIVLAVILANFTIGLPLTDGLLIGLRGDGWHVMGERGSKAERMLPESALGIPVTAVEQNAFRSDSLLNRVEIPGNIRIIGDMAFYGCPELTGVTLKNGVSKIGAAGFAFCPKLSSAVLPDTLEAISADTFSESSENLIIYGARSSEANAFADRAGFSFVDLGEMEFEPVEGGLMLTGLYSEAQDLVLPSEVNGIPVTAISEDVRIISADRLVLPEHLKTIPAFLCEDNLGLETLIMGPEVREIGENAFRTCISLNRITWSDNLESIGDFAFYECRSLGPDLRLPDRVKTIGEYAFSSCNSLESVWLPDTAAGLGRGCFSQDENLKAARLPEKLEAIPDATFSCTGIKTVRIPAAVKLIGEYAFSACDLEYQLIPESVEYVADNSFLRCEHLQWLEFLNDSVSFQTSLSGAVHLCCPGLIIGGRTGSSAEKEAAEAGYSFERIDQWSSGLILEDETACAPDGGTETAVRVPCFNEKDNCPIRSTSGFQNSPDLRRIELPLFQTVIHEDEFRLCKQLEQVVPRSTITQIGGGAFSYCVSLQSVSFSYGLEAVGSCAFQFCEQLKRIVLPDSVTHLDTGALSSCGLEEFTIPAGVRGLNPVFQSTDITRLSVPGTVVDALDGISEMPRLQTLIFDEGIIAFSQISDCPSLETVSLPSTLTRMPEIPFVRCDHLRTVRVHNPQTDFSRVTAFPSSVSIIGYPGSTAETFAKGNGLRFYPFERLF